MNVDEICKAIRNLENASHKDVMVIHQELKNLHSRIQSQKLHTFNVGDKVLFTAHDGRVHIGILTKRNRKTVQVLVKDGVRSTNWKVSPNLLSFAG